MSVSRGRYSTHTVDSSRSGTKNCVASYDPATVGGVVDPHGRIDRSGGIFPDRVSEQVG